MQPIGNFGSHLFQTPINAGGNGRQACVLFSPFVFRISGLSSILSFHLLIIPLSSWVFVTLSWILSFRLPAL